MPNANVSLKALFEHALELDSAEAREAYLLEACGDDDVLRERVWDLLRAYEESDRFLPPTPAAFDDASTTEKPGTVIGRYKLLEQIGEGGFGVVFLAEQEEPVRRKVALKIIKAGMDTKQVIARFEAERQALAMMDHPNIAKVLDAGATEQGRPYFVMDLVEGLPITQFCEEHQLTIKERLELFIQVCQAIQHAHQKGVIHRDIKPSNVLVATEGVGEAGRDEEQTTHQPGGEDLDCGGRSRVRGRRHRFAQADKEKQPAEKRRGSRVRPSTDTGSSHERKARPHPFPLPQGEGGVSPGEGNGGGHRPDARPSTEIKPAQSRSAPEGIEPQRAQKESPSLRSLWLDNLCPKVIDFGVAKAIDQRLTEKTLHTNFARMIGTPAYMSPEQAEMSQQDVDTRSDVYSLGILLYELLTGTTPFPEERLKTVSYAELQRIITEEEPARPSTALSRLNGHSRQVATNRRTEPAALQKRVRGDLDWIVLKALEKDRNRRYETANGLAMDIHRHLTNEPVVARPPSTAYKVQKFIRRNRTAAVAGLAVAAVTLLGVAGITWQSLETRREKANVEATLRFIREDLLAPPGPLGPNPNPSLNPNMKLLTAVQQAAQGIEDRYKDQPAVLAEIQLTLGMAFKSLGELESADRYLQAGFGGFQTEFGSKHPKTLATGLEIARLLSNQSHYEDAIALCHELLEECERVLGSDHRLTLETMSCLGWSLVFTGRYAEASGLFEAILQFAQPANKEHYWVTVDAMMGRWAVVFYQGRYSDQTLAMAREAYERARDTLGPDHPTTLGVAIEVANQLRNGQHRYHEADELANETFTRCRRVLGEQHGSTLFLMSEIAVLASTRGLPYVPLQREVFDRTEQALGADNRSTLLEKMRLGLGLANAGYLSEGESLLRDAVDRLTVVSGPEATFTLWSREWLAGVHVQQGRFQEAEALKQEVVEAAERALPPESNALYRHRRTLGNLYARQAKWRDAAQTYRTSLHYHPAGEARHFAAGMVVARLAENEEAFREIATLSLERFRDTENPDDAHEIAFSLLLLFDGLPAADRAHAFQLADRALDEPGDPAQQALLAGMVACRQGAWSDALAHLNPLKDYPNAATAILAGFLLAEAHHAVGQGELARAALLHADERLGRTLRCGDLGNTRQYPAEEWLPYAMCIVARHNSDLRTNGRTTLRAISPEILADAREEWKPVEALLEAANWSARRRQWAQAKEQFLQAMGHDYFDWDAAALQTRGFAGNLARLLVLTGDREGYDALCRRLCAFQPGGLLANASLVVIVSDWADVDLKRAALASIQRNMGIQQRRNKPASELHWFELTLGQAEYCNGNYAEALAALEPAQDAYNIRLAGAANAYAALAARKLGRTDEAHRHLTKAEALFHELSEATPDDLESSWQSAALFEIALTEVRHVIKETDE